MNKVTAFFENKSTWAPVILRIGLGAVFLWFGWSALTSTDMWIRLVPAWVSFIGTPEALVKAHGVFEIVFGLLLILGVYGRLVAAILMFNLLHTVFLVSGPTMIRDIGLTIALLSLVFNPGRSFIRS